MGDEGGSIIGRRKLACGSLLICGIVIGFFITIPFMTVFPLWNGICLHLIRRFQCPALFRLHVLPEGDKGVLRNNAKHLLFVYSLTWLPHDLPFFESLIKIYGKSLNVVWSERFSVLAHQMNDLGILSVHQKYSSFCPSQFNIRALHRKEHINDRVKLFLPLSPRSRVSVLFLPFERKVRRRSGQGHRSMLYNTQARYLACLQDF